MWSDTIKTILNEKVDTFIEIGPKKTLLNFYQEILMVISSHFVVLRILIMFKDKKLLVTGGTGSIGGSICSYFKSNETVMKFIQQQQT